MAIKKFKGYFLILMVMGAHIDIMAQMIWRNPLMERFSVVQGQALPVQSFGRLPVQMKDEVRQVVWDLSQNSAGEYIEFNSNATKIIVRYAVAGAFSMPHMPSTGVSGLDLYANDGNGQWDWAPGKYSFKDTVTYTFDHLSVNRGKKFRLYLPLYNTVKWLEIGVGQNEMLTFLPINKEKPIVIYGTSIAQGGCASRPGLAWPAILGRDLERPVVNLGFSGNGRLEMPIINLMGKIEAKLFILDCMPNLGAQALYPEEELRKRINGAIEALQQQQNVPILLVEHSGGNTNHILDTEKNEEFRRSSAVLSKIYKELKEKGTKNIYLLTTKAIGMGINSTVDGAHPNDIGMMEHAIAFGKKYREIFK